MKQIKKEKVTVNYFVMSIAAFDILNDILKESV